MTPGRKHVTTFLLLSGFVVSANGAAVKLPVRLVAPATFPVVLTPGDPLPKLVVLVRNTTPIARQVVVEAFAFGEDKTLLKQYSLAENVRAGDSALVLEVMEPCHAGFTETACSVGAVQVRAFSEELANQPKPLPPWLHFGASDFSTSFDSFGRRQAGASVVVSNTGGSDAHVYLRFRLYNSSGFQVAACNNERRPIFSDNNILVPSGSATRLWCEVSPFKEVPDVPSTVRVELLGWETRH